METTVSSGELLWFTTRRAANAPEEDMDLPAGHLGQPLPLPQRRASCSFQSSVGQQLQRHRGEIQYCGRRTAEGRSPPPPARRFHCEKLMLS